MSTTPKSLFETYSFKKSALDTGSPESQAARMTQRINHITQHIKKNKKDYASILAIKKMAQKRKNNLNYLKKKDISRYRAICEQLSLKK